MSDVLFAEYQVVNSNSEKPLRIPAIVSALLNLRIMKGMFCVLGNYFERKWNDTLTIVERFQLLSEGCGRVDSFYQSLELVRRNFSLHYMHLFPNVQVLSCSTLP